MEEDVSKYIQAGVLCFLGVVGLSANAFIFLLFYKKRSVRTFSNRFVLSLATSHILQCVLLVPTLLTSIYGWGFGAIFCKVTISLTVCLNLASSLSILLIAIDRNCAVNSPLHYTVTITKRRTGLLISTAWFVAFTLSIPTLIGVPNVADNYTNQTWDFWRISRLVYFLLISTIGFLIPFISVSCLYFAMFRAAKNNNARGRRSSSNSSASSEVVVSYKPPKKAGVNEYSLRRNYSSEHDESKGHAWCFIRKHKATVTGLLVVLSFVLCWSPYFFSLIIVQFLQVSENLLHWANLATFMSCILNPYVYFFRNKNSWKQAKCMITHFFRNEIVVEQAARKRKVTGPDHVFRLPTSFTQTELTSPMPLDSNSTFDLGPQKPIVAHQGKGGGKKGGIFMVDPVKPLLHQDSSSSNDSSEACITTVMMGSVLSMDDDSTIWYQPFQQRTSEDSMIEIPLDRDEET